MLGFWFWKLGRLSQSKDPHLIFQSGFLQFSGRKYPFSKKIFRMVIFVINRNKQKLKVLRKDQKLFPVCTFKVSFRHSLKVSDSIETTKQRDTKTSINSTWQLKCWKVKCWHYLETEVRWYLPSLIISQKLSKKSKRNHCFGTITGYICSSQICLGFRATSDLYMLSTPDWWKFLHSRYSYALTLSR